MGLNWVKASVSQQNANCVEVAMADTATDCAGCHNIHPDKDGRVLIVVRDSKDPNGPHLHFTREEWDAFKDGMAAGEFVHRTRAGARWVGWYCSVRRVKAE